MEITTLKTSSFANKFDDGESCVRLYNGKGEHILSLLPCSYHGHDENNVIGFYVNNLGFRNEN